MLNAEGEKGRDKPRAWIHRPPSNSQVLVTTDVKAEKENYRKKKMAYSVYEKKRKKAEVTSLMGLPQKKIGRRG